MVPRPREGCDRCRQMAFFFFLLPPHPPRVRAACAGCKSERGFSLRVQERQLMVPRPREGCDRCRQMAFFFFLLPPHPPRVRAACAGCKSERGFSLRVQERQLMVPRPREGCDQMAFFLFSYGVLVLPLPRPPSRSAPPTSSVRRYPADRGRLQPQGHPAVQRLRSMPSDGSPFSFSGGGPGPAPSAPTHPPAHLDQAS